MRSHIYLLLTLVFYTAGALHVVALALTSRRILTSWTLALGGHPKPAIDGHLKTGH